MTGENPFDELRREIDTADEKKKLRKELRDGRAFEAVEEIDVKVREIILDLRQALYHDSYAAIAISETIAKARDDYTYTRWDSSGDSLKRLRYELIKGDRRGIELMNSIRTSLFYTPPHVGFIRESDEAKIPTTKIWREEKDYILGLQGKIGDCYFVWQVGTFHFEKRQYIGVHSSRHKVHWVDNFSVLLCLDAEDRPFFQVGKLWTVDYKGVPHLPYTKYGVTNVAFSVIKLLEAVKKWHKEQR